MIRTQTIASRNQLRYEREIRGWSQAKVAEELGTTPNNISRWECGLTMPSPHYREKLCTLYQKNARVLGLLPENEVQESEPVPAVIEEPIVTISSEAEEQVVACYDPIIPLPIKGDRILVGRDELLKELKRKLTSEPAVLVSLNGLPGVGKTTLATALVHDQDLRAYFTDGILWAGLGPEPNLLAHLSRWGMLLGITISKETTQSSLEEWAKILRATIGQRRLLIVIDDAWSLQEAISLKIGGFNCAYIVTTRFPQIAAAIALDKATTVPELSTEEGVALLAHFVPELVINEPETVRTLVQSVGALPMALNLIGKHLHVQGYSGQQRRLHTAIDKLHSSETRLHLTDPTMLADRPPSLLEGAKPSLLSVIAISDHMLDPRAQSALRSLAIFPAKPNTFSEEAALAVCQQPVEILDQLSDAGLLESASSGRYMLHQTIADYALAHHHDQQARIRLMHYMIDELERNQYQHQLLEQDSNNILLALETAFTLRCQHELVRGVRAFVPFLLKCGLYTLTETHIQRALQVAIDLDTSSDIIYMWYNLGKTAELQGDYLHATTYLNEGLKRAREHYETSNLCDLLSLLGTVANKRGEYQEAYTYLEEGLTLVQRGGDNKQRVDLLTSLGSLEVQWGHYERAYSLLKEALPLAREQGYKEQLSGILNNLGIIARDQSDYSLAEQYYQQALTIIRELGHRERLCAVFNNVGALYAEQGRYNRADRYYQLGLKLARQIGHREHTARLLNNIGSSAIEQKAYKEAQEYLQEALTLVRDMGYRQLQGYILDNLGSLAIEQKDYTQAEVYLNEGLSIVRPLGLALLQGILLCDYGELLLNQKRLKDASEAFQEAQKILPSGTKDWQAAVLYGQARIEAAQKHLRKARQLGENSLAIFAAIGHNKANKVSAWLQSFPDLAEKAED